jgi:hypothetical protein
MSRGWSSYVLKLHPIGDVAGDIHAHDRNHIRCFIPNFDRGTR